MSKTVMKAMFPALLLVMSLLLASPKVDAWSEPDVSTSTLISKTNELRIEAGLPELVVNEDLTRIAQTRADEIAGSGTLSHIRPNGETWSNLYFNSSTGKYIFPYCGENLARGQKTSADAVSELSQSETHYANMVNPRMTMIGCGVAKDANGRVIYVQEFAGNK